MQKFLILIALLLAMAQTAQGEPIEVGLFTQNNLRTCGSPDLCFSGDSIIDFVSDFDVGGTGTVSTQQMDPLDPGAQGASSAGFQGPGFTPALSSYAYAGVQTRFTVLGLAIQRYEFLSDGALNIGGALTYSQSGSTSPNAENPSGQTSGGFLSFQMADDVLDTDNCNFLGDITRRNASGTLLSCILRNGESAGSFGLIEFLGLSSVQSAVFDIGTDPVTDGLSTANLVINGLQGDVYYIGAYLGSTAHLGGFSDSSNTLLLDLDNPSLVQASFAEDSFVSAPARVPEPGALTLLLIGLLGLGLVKRNAG